MASYGIIILSSIYILLHCIRIQASRDQISLLKVVNNDNQVQHQVHATAAALRHTENNEVTTNLRSWKGQSFSHSRHHVKYAHGILNMVAWGTPLPIGVVIARFFSKFPMKYGEWNKLHVLFQPSGYLVGTIGWGVGLWLGNSSEHYTLKTHRIPGILVFTFGTLQVSLEFFYFVYQSILMINEHDYKR